MNKNKFRNKKWYNNAVAILIGVVGYVVLTHLGPIGAAFSPAAVFGMLA